MKGFGSEPADPHAPFDSGSSVSDIEHVLAASPVVLYSAELTADGMVPVWVSSNVKSIFGYDADEALEPGWWFQHLHPEDRARAAQSGSLRQQQQYTHEYRFRHANGAYIRVLDQIRIVERGGTRTAVGSWTDVSAVRRQQEQLEAANAHYHRLIHTSPYAIYTLDSQGRFTELNAAAERLLGRTDVLGVNFAEIIAPEDLEFTNTLFSDVMSGAHESLERELRIRRPDGELRLLSVAVAPIREGGVVGAHGIARDITDDRRIEQERERARQQYERLVTASPDAIYALDLDGRFTEVSRATAELLGRPVEELIGMPFSSIVAPEDMHKAASAFRRRLEGETEVSEFELHIVRKDGERRLVHIRGTHISDGERVLGSQGIGRDITEEVAREQQLRRAERLASVGTLVAGVAHELNNPLTAIGGFAELMLMEPQSDENREMLELTMREATRAAKIVADLRLLARETQRTSPSSRGPVDLNDVVDHVLKLQRYTLDTSNILVDVDLADDLPRVHGNIGELEQVMLNLIVNARQALEEKRLASPRISVRTRPTKGGAMLRIADNGPGIPQRDLERIFDPFFTTKSPGQGMGLGLSLVHRIVTEHDGQIQVESSAGSGAAFMVTLPRAGAAPRESPDAPPDPGAANLRILVVDDEEPIRRAVMRYLSRRGHVTDGVSEGGEALKLIESHAYDIILTDLRMPGMGGERLLDALREQDPNVARRVMFMTGHVARDDATLTTAYADVPLIEKPFSLTDLGRQVEELAERLGGGG